MPANTPDQQITYPVGTDLADNPNAFLDMLADVEQRLVRMYTNLADRTARMLVLSENDVSALGTENRLDVYDGTQHVSLATRSHNNFIPRNATAAAINNSTVLVPDATLTAPIVITGASSVYLFSCVVFYDSSTAADIKFAFTVPAGSLRWGGMGLATGTAASSGDMTSSSISTSGVALAFGGAGVGTVVWWRAEGWLSATASGNIELSYAQNAADATNTTVRAGSWLRVTKMT